MCAQFSGGWGRGSPVCGWVGGSDCGTRMQGISRAPPGADRCVVLAAAQRMDTPGVWRAPWQEVCVEDLSAGQPGPDASGSDWADACLSPEGFGRNDQNFTPLCHRGASCEAPRSGPRSQAPSPPVSLAPRSLSGAPCTSALLAVPTACFPLCCGFCSSTPALAQDSVASLVLGGHGWRRHVPADLPGVERAALPRMCTQGQGLLVRWVGGMLDWMGAQGSPGYGPVGPRPADPGTPPAELWPLFLHSVAFEGQPQALGDMNRTLLFLSPEAREVVTHSMNALRLGRDTGIWSCEVRELGLDSGRLEG